MHLALSPNRKASLLFALSAIGLAACAGLIVEPLVEAGGVRDLASSPQMWWPFYAVALPALVAGACSLVLWQSDAAHVRLTVLLFSAAVVAFLIGFGIYVVAIIFGAPVGALLIWHRKQSA
ncbi:MAG: hypothetical protein WB784_13220 [Rhodanobacteraceae bacterium]